MRERHTHRYIKKRQTQRNRKREKWKEREILRNRERGSKTRYAEKELGKGVFIFDKKKKGIEIDTTESDIKIDTGTKEIYG